ncbi:hypothetical protein ALC56_06161 [Trachymyrmex septentrionalis]|uniref:Uncharacterized protein n=1 Tax=Trachymyrmex septentrionalis TaxID=34720 RepID=A0A195FH19_9HYME|nr:hypothetical protein ALC56_06161 [Trachymyrmex septentrionalis]
MSSVIVVRDDKRIFTTSLLRWNLGRHKSGDAAIRFPRMSNWALTRWENRPRNTHVYVKRPTRNVDARRYRYR